MSAFMESCQSCKYAVKVEALREIMECHRNPSQVAGINEDGDIVSSFPAVDGSEWCGEYRGKVPDWGEYE